jgi:hypothetical protein
MKAGAKDGCDFSQENFNQQAPVTAIAYVMLA